MDPTVVHADHPHIFANKGLIVIQINDKIAAARSGRQCVHERINVFVRFYQFGGRIVFLMVIRIQTQNGKHLHA